MWLGAAKRHTLLSGGRQKYIEHIVARRQRKKPDHTQRISLSMNEEQCDHRKQQKIATAAV
jgi:hypothetical protein